MRLIEQPTYGEVICVVGKKGGEGNTFLQNYINYVLLQWLTCDYHWHRYWCVTPCPFHNEIPTGSITLIQRRRQSRITCWRESKIGTSTLQWRHNECDCVSNHQPHDCLLNRLFRRRSRKTSKIRVTGLCEGNSPMTGEFPAQRASNAENVSIWWRHHVRNCRWWPIW